MTRELLHSWTIRGGAGRIECPASALEPIVAVARTGVRQFRHGGLEVGGVLFGDVDSASVRITGSQPFEIEYGRGAHFLFTESDNQRFSDFLRDTNRNLAPRGWQVVGYYESHTRRGVTLPETNLELFDTHFPDAHSVFFVLRPEKDDSAVPLLYVRDSDGNVAPADPQPPALIASEPEPAILPLPDLARDLEPEPRPEYTQECINDTTPPTGSRQSTAIPVAALPAWRPMAPPLGTISMDAGTRRRIWGYATSSVLILGFILWMLFGRTAGTPPPPERAVEAPPPSAPSPPPISPEVETPKEKPVATSTGQTKRKKRVRARRTRTKPAQP